MGFAEFVFAGIPSGINKVSRCHYLGDVGSEDDTQWNGRLVRVCVCMCVLFFKKKKSCKVRF